MLQPKSLKELGVPWYYRFRFTNWLIAQPWSIYPVSRKGWHYGTLYRVHRSPAMVKNLDTGIFEPLPGSQTGVLTALWRAITFPHVHHDLEDWQ